MPLPSVSTLPLVLSPVLVGAVWANEIVAAHKGRAKSYRTNFYHGILLTTRYTRRETPTAIRASIWRARKIFDPERNKASVCLSISVLGHHRTFRNVGWMSALPR